MALVFIDLRGSAVQKTLARVKLGLLCNGRLFADVCLLLSKQPGPPTIQGFPGKSVAHEPGAEYVNR